MAQAAEMFSADDPDARVREIKAWLNTKGVRDFEPVSLFCDHLSKVIYTSLHSDSPVTC